MSRQRLFAALTSAFGLLAVVLACVGIYGMMAEERSQPGPRQLGGHGPGAGRRRFS